MNQITRGLDKCIYGYDTFNIKYYKIGIFSLFVGESLSVSPTKNGQKFCYGLLSLFYRCRWCCNYGGAVYIHCITAVQDTNKIA